MLRIESKNIAYRNWQIKVVIQEGAFTFCCYPPDIADFCNDGSTYDSVKDALIAARDFVDREIAVDALLDIAWEWFEDGRISEMEYWNLTEFD